MSDEHRDAQLKAAHRALDAARNALLDALAAVALAPIGDRDCVAEVASAVELAVRASLRSDTTVAGERWELDIIDGESNVSNGVPLWGVSLTLIENGHPVLGMIGLPICQVRFWAVVGQGAQSNTRPLSTRTVARPAIMKALARRNAIRLHPSATTALDLAWEATRNTHATVWLSAPPGARAVVDDDLLALLAGLRSAADVSETGTTERPPGWLVDLIVEAHLDDVKPAIGSLLLEWSNKRAARLSNELPASAIRLPFDVTADILLRLGESAREFAGRLATVVALAAGAPEEAAPIIGRIASKLATRAIEDPLQMAALTLRVTGWVLQHELTHYLEMLEQADVSIDPAQAAERVVSQLVSQGGRTELRELILGAFPALLASEGFQEELRLVVELHEQPSQKVDPPDPTPKLTADPDLNRVRGRNLEAARKRAMEATKQIEAPAPDLGHKRPGRGTEPPGHDPW